MLVNQTDGSSFSFAMILCVFLVSLAVGAALCAIMVDDNDQRLFGLRAADTADDVVTRGLVDKSEPLSWLLT